MAEPVIAVVKSWDWPDLRRQLPGRELRWGGVRFTFDTGQPADAAVILTGAPAGTVLTCPPERVWLMMQEPPNEAFAAFHQAPPVFSRVYTTDDRLEGERYRKVPPALPWHVDRDYDWLSRCPMPAKDRHISCIASGKAIFSGHQARLRFLADLRKHLSFDLFGRGFCAVADKWDVLAPYRFSIAVENFRGPLYWSEKLADCFLAWTLPIYVGCTDIGRWFPRDAVISVDMDDTDAIARLLDTLSQPDLWESRLDALAEARRRVLDRYNIFAFLAAEFEEAGSGGPARRVEIPTAWRPLAGAS
ncbi:glycosyltransferase family 10 [Azospirillum sp. SYSU D00513]|uniref:glycosyltransferase family 10 domain-containing protein n=1 Tax=Azospirillum sp. SYSU D00513 TaxID=2812561 RepID=UPI001A97C073|nr:glycosyltransferase family 10 [Azospirillum sp. SYSU D00513]